jgi:glycosyltransferase involved in cell wall biosynthesis
MKVSVVIPTFNEAKYLPATLDSIRRLSRQPDEVLVLDSNSTDKTRAIAKKYGARVVTEKKRGIGLARQKGLEASKGEIVAFTDADTIVPPDWLTKIIETLQQKDVVGVYSGMRVYDGWAPYRFHIAVTIPLLMEIHHLIGMPLADGKNTAFWRKAAIKAGGYPTNFQIGEDMEMAQRLMRVGKVVYRRDNFVLSSGRRGKEGWPILWRTTKFYFSYILLHRVDGHTFPDMR